MLAARRHALILLLVIALVGTISACGVEAQHRDLGAWCDEFISGMEDSAQIALALLGRPGSTYEDVRDMLVDVEEWTERMKRVAPADIAAANEGAAEGARRTRRVFEDHGDELDAAAFRRMTETSSMDVELGVPSYDSHAEAMYGYATQNCAGFDAEMRRIFDGL